MKKAIGICAGILAPLLMTTNAGAITLSEYLISGANRADVATYEAGNMQEMYTFEHDATEQTGALIDYRYIGNTPNNYVYFNCTDDNDTSTCEVWRIIGVFEAEDKEDNKENRVKLIRQDAIDDILSWDAESNEWSTASLNTYLNGTYYDNLSATAKAMIKNAKYYLGGVVSPSGQTGSNMYDIERGTATYGDLYPDFVRTTSWTGNVALMYPSDYAYSYALGVDDTCYTDERSCSTGNPSAGWIFNAATQWTLTPRSNGASYALYLNKTGDLTEASGRVFSQLYIRPVIYLSADIYKAGGDGSQQNPYQVSLEEVFEGPDDDTEKPSVINPQTGDNVSTYIVALLVSALGAVSSISYLIRKS